jgi:serine/threonine protein kinase
MPQDKGKSNQSAAVETDLTEANPGVELPKSSQAASQSRGYDSSEAEGEVSLGEIFSSQSDATEQNLHALTQINKLFQSQHSEHGFARAQNDINEALGGKEIMLNKRFALVSVIGAGGMGTVYKARDIRKVEAQDANPYVAVKVLNSDFRSHPDAFISLQREASRSHLLSHPHIVTVHDFDRDGNTIYMTMELLKGEALDNFLYRHQKTGVERAKALEIISQLCTALEFAHQKGIIHSDLKPANIFISSQGVKILDFGIARIAASSQYQDQFDAGAIGAITPAYASLEMIEKKSPDASDDVYAAAIIAYELLDGAHPFRGKSAAAALALKLEPARIEGLSSRQWRALAKALALQRKDRTASINEFYQGLTATFRFPVFKVASLVLLLVVGWFSYTQFLVPDELTQFVEQTLHKAQQCFTQEDYICAISSVNAVLKIEPDNRVANDLLQSAELAHESRLVAESVIKDNAQAERCLQDGNFQCVLEKTARVLSHNAENAIAHQMAQQAKLALEQLDKLKAQQIKSYNDNLNLATNCFKNKNYACAIKYGEAALTIKTGDVDANSIVRNATYAQQQEKENLQKANKILQDGQDCLTKLNYSCAIAKSESALEFVPGHQNALAMKREAEKAIANLKKTIEIE